MRDGTPSKNSLDAGQSSSIPSVADNTVVAWKGENAAAVREFNLHVALNGLPLAEFRKF